MQRLVRSTRRYVMGALVEVAAVTRPSRGRARQTGDRPEVCSQSRGRVPVWRGIRGLRYGRLEVASGPAPSIPHPLEAPRRGEGSVETMRAHRPHRSSRSSSRFGITAPPGSHFPAHSARPTAVLPEDESMMVCPGRSEPLLALVDHDPRVRSLSTPVSTTRMPKLTPRRDTGSDSRTGGAAARQGHSYKAVAGASSSAVATARPCSKWHDHRGRAGLSRSLVANTAKLGSADLYCLRSWRERRRPKRPSATLLAQDAFNASVAW